MERTPNKSQCRESAPEEKTLPPLLPGFELATFRSRARRSNQQAISRLLSPKKIKCGGAQSVDVDFEVFRVLSGFQDGNSHCVLQILRSNYRGMYFVKYFVNRFAWLHLNSHLIYPLTSRVVGAPQMMSQPVSSIFSLFFTALWDLANSRPVHFPDVISPPLLLSALSSSSFHCALQDGFGQT